MRPGIFGKWHLDGKDGAAPEEQGFDVVFAILMADGKRIRRKPQGDLLAHPGGAASSWKPNKDRPFFVYLPHYAIHTALQARPSRRWTNSRTRRRASSITTRCMPPAPTIWTTASASCSTSLTNSGWKRTRSSSSPATTAARKQSSQEPLRGNKGCYYEGGIREPFIVRWPGVVEPGSVCDVPVINVDLFPTFLDAAGAPVPAGKVLDGESLLPLLKGEGELQRQAIFWHFPGYLDRPVIRGRPLDVRTGFRTRPVSVIRKGDWKLHLFHEEWQLDGGREQARNQSCRRTVQSGRRRRGAQRSFCERTGYAGRTAGGSVRLV